MEPILWSVVQSYRVSENLGVMFYTNSVHFYLKFCVMLVFADIRAIEAQACNTCASFVTDQGLQGRKHLPLFVVAT